MSESETTEAPESSSGESLITDTPSNNPLSSWKDSLSDEIKSDPSLSTFKDVDGLAKSYIHAQKMVGSERVPVPRDDWTESDWNGYYDKLGRPETYQEYETPKVDLPEDFNLPEESISDTKKAFYELGLSKKQAEGVLTHYMDGLSKQVNAHFESNTTTNEEATQMLNEEWGNDYNYNIDVARGALKKFGSEALIEKLEQTSMGNDPELIKTFHKIGSMIVEDDVRGGRSSMELNGSSNAMAEIGNLKTNPGFMKQLFNRNETGHDEAKRRWEELHSMAFAE